MNAADHPRTPFIAGNWKMHKTVGEAETFVRALLPRVSSVEHLQIGLCVPFISLGPLRDDTRGSPVEIYAQTMHENPSGAYTGEISPTMLADLDIDGVVLGHSERREYDNETDKHLQLKVPAALEAGLTPILCVGETEGERDAGDTQRKLRHQVQEGLARVSDEALAGVVIAYEPIWAIGTGQVATPEQAQDACGFVRALVGDRSEAAAREVRVLYGGSMKPGNAAELLALPDIDGGLIGGASLDVDDFVAIVDAAAG